MRWQAVILVRSGIDIKHHSIDGRKNNLKKLMTSYGIIV